MTTKKMIQMSAMIAAFASAGFAQQGLKAKVDFPFVAQGVTMEAGNYNLSPTSSIGGRSVYTLRNADTKRSILIPNLIVAEAKAGVPHDAKLVFHCGAASGCRLAQIWEGTSQYSEIIQPRKSKADEPEQFTEVAMTKATPRGR